jgi:hypothetical protein
MTALETHISDVEKAHFALTEYLRTLRELVKRKMTGKPLGIDDDVALHKLCLALIEMAVDGDFMSLRDEVCADCRWDADGFPIDEDGHRTGRGQYAAVWEGMA